MVSRVLSLWLAVGVLLIATPRASAALVLTVNYSGPSQYEAAFTSAKSTWEGLLTGYQNGVVVATTAGSSYNPGETITQLFIDATVTAIDGAGGTLGRAGWTERAVDQLGYSLSTDGIMEFDSADVDNLVLAGSWEAVILHEMAHVMGFGTQWVNNNVYVTGSGEFLGSNATQAWQSEFGQTGTPDVELGGGAGTRNGHWNEVDGGAGLTGITNAQGRDMRDELMTGWLNSNSFISHMTVQSFVDIGFTAVPEPSALLLVLLGGVPCVTLRHRRPA